MNLDFMRCVNERERRIWQLVIVKNKLMSVFKVLVNENFSTFFDFVLFWIFGMSGS